MNAPAAGNLPRPYPGLRPFEPDEWSIFFGRERMIDDVIDRLTETRVVLIHGASGAGKSSLVRAGVLPKLERQHRRRGSAWRTCAMRPAGGPLWNLAAEFARLESRTGDIDRISALVTRFSAEGASFGTVAGELDGLAGQGLCVLIDQFEELFRFEKETSREEAELFAELIGRALEAPSESFVDLRVILTMRSEFLGECSRYAGLAETINRTQYLVPRLDDEALLRAVLRPAQIYGGRFEEQAAERLIASVRGREDELPLLQHGLMLLWDEGVRLGAPTVLDDARVEAVGGLAELLSAHADSVLAEAAPDLPRQGLVERLFRELTDVNAEGSAIRRPRTLRDLAATIGAKWEELTPLIDAFRVPGVSFLTPFAPEPLQETTRIDISHEALIRCWRRIAPDGWLRAEVEDGLAWRSLLTEARAFSRDKGRVLSAGATRDRGRLIDGRNESWSLRYGGGWKQVLALLDASRTAARAAKRQRRVRTALLSAVAVGALGFAGVAGFEWKLAKDAADQAQHETMRARDASERAENEAKRDRESRDMLATLLLHIENLQQSNGSSAYLEHALFNKLIATANQGSVAAKAMVAVLYYYGTGTNMDVVRAGEWWASAAADGDARSMTNLGTLYSYGEGVAKDYVKAQEWWEKGAAAGDGVSMKHLGDLYEAGVAVPRDYVKAREWFERAAAVGDNQSFGAVGRFFENGLGVSQDYQKAREWYEKGAAAGDTTSMYNLGAIYESGRDVAQSYAKAREWYEVGAAAGSAAAMGRVGLFYNLGLGVDQNDRKAREWYEKAAEAGDASSMYNLGLLYFNGQGVVREYSRARQWYRKAADAGYEPAWSGLALTSLLMTDFGASYEAIERAKTLNSDDLQIALYRAHILMYLDRTDEARRIYLSHRNETVPDYNCSWRRAVLDDFQRFRESNLRTTPLMGEIETKFSNDSVSPIGDPTPHE